jgi:hypothetical protein
MARGRFVSQEITKDKKINNLSDDTSRLAFTWLLTMTDCEGRTYGDPAIVRSMVFPRRSDVTVEQMETYIKEWHDSGMALWYESAGDMWISFPNFEKHQVGLRKDKEAPSVIPPPPDSKQSNSVPDPEIVQSNSVLGTDVNGLSLSKKKLIEVEDEVEDEVDDEGEDDLEIITAAATTANIQPFGQLYDAFLEATKIAPTMLNEHKAADTIREWVAAKITPQEVTQAITEMQQKDLTIVGPWSVTNAINIVRSKGSGKKKLDHDAPEARARYAQWNKK